MKMILASTALLLGFCYFAGAQGSTANRIVVPGRNSSRPRVVNCSLLNGSITVKTHTGNDVIVEEPASDGSTRGRREPPPPPGMKRIDAPMPGLEVSDDDNTITVSNRMPVHGGAVTITVPPDTSLHLKTNHGEITVAGVRGEVTVHTLSGKVDLQHISGTVSADSLNGPITVTMDRVDAAKPMAFSTLNGPIDVTLPATLKANVSIKSDRGAVYTDYDITLGPRVSAEKNSSSDGKFRIRMDHTIQGTINGGGTDLTFHTLNGSIYIRKQK